jgi:hypothetical protein
MKFIAHLGRSALIPSWNVPGQPPPPLRDKFPTSETRSRLFFVNFLLARPAVDLSPRNVLQLRLKKPSLCWPSR